MSAQTGDAQRLREAQEDLDDALDLVSQWSRRSSEAEGFSDRFASVLRRLMGGAGAVGRSEVADLLDDWFEWRGRHPGPGNGRPV